MITGYLYQKTEKEVKKDIENKIIVSAGVDVNSILETITINEINFSNDPALVLAELKKECMIILGKVKEAGANETETQTD
jgi:hypothetical protein